MPLPASEPASPHFRATWDAADLAREEFEAAFRAYVNNPPSTTLLAAAATNYDRWQTLTILKTVVAYYEHYRVFPHSPGAP